MKRSIIAAAWIVTLAASTSWGILVNVQFQQMDDGDPDYPVYSGTGAAPDTGTYWNQVGNPWNGGAFQIASGSNLTASDGSTATTIDVQVGNATYGVRPVYQLGGNTGNALLNLGFLNNQTPTLQSIPITLSGLTPGGGYNLWLYSAGPNSDWVTDFTFGTTKSTAGSVGSPTTTTIPATDENISFVYFAGLTADGSGEIAGTFDGGTLTGVYRPFLNGLQIESAPVPEPSTVVLLGLGALMIRWRRSKLSPSR